MYGLLGEHLPHSFSPQIHSALGNRNYNLFEVAPENLDAFMKKHGPTNHYQEQSATKYTWLSDPWPWEYCANKEG